MAEPLPATITAEKLSTAHTALSAALAPVTAEGYAVATGMLAQFGQAFAIPAEQIDLALMIYRDAFADLPGDVLIAAVRKVCANWTWGNRLPMPGDIRKAAEPLVEPRQIAMHHVRRAQHKLRMETLADRDARHRAAAQVVRPAATRTADVSALAKASVRRVAPPRDMSQAEMEAARHAQLAELARVQAQEAAE